MKIFIKTVALALAVALAFDAHAEAFLFFNCPLKAGFGFNATYYEDGVPKCVSATLAVTAPDGSVQNLQTVACANGVHAFPAFEARQQGAYKLRASAGSASRECVAAGVALRERQRVPEINLGVVVLVALIALALARRNEFKQRLPRE